LILIAAVLQPERGPWWVDQPGGRTPSQGWWWIPAGERYPQYLGHNAAVAEVNLVQLLDAELAPR
jgi:hypothetical protein